MTNTNPETGIRYGTIYLNSLDGDTAQWLWDNGENVSEREAYEDLKSSIELDLRWEVDNGRLNEVEFADELDYRLEHACENLQIEEPVIEGTCDGVSYAISWLGGAPLLWVFDSPVISKVRLCSPCVPNAGDLDSLDDDGYECYGIPADWYAKD